MLLIQNMQKYIHKLIIRWHLKQYFEYLKYVVQHKWHVLKECLKLNVPLYVAILHDWDKFLPHMIMSYSNHFRNSDGTRIETPDLNDLPFEIAVLQHVNRNKHHWQYWIAIQSDGTIKSYPMPDLYRREMLADWHGAGKAHGKPDTQNWYLLNRNKIILHPETRIWIEEQLNITITEDN